MNGLLQYHKTASKYVLYSIGPDGIDNGGKPIVDPAYTGLRRYIVNPDSKGDIVASVNIY